MRREVFEEVGLRVKNVTYYKSQPWPFPDSVMIGFFAELDGDASITLQESELAEAVWFERQNIPPTLTSTSIAQELIECVRNGVNELYLDLNLSLIHIFWYFRKTCGAPPAGRRFWGQALACRFPRLPQRRRPAPPPTLKRKAVVTFGQSNGGSQDAGHYQAFWPGRRQRQRLP